MSRVQHSFCSAPTPANIDVNKDQRSPDLVIHSELDVFSLLVCRLVAGVTEDAKKDNEQKADPLETVVR